MKKLFWLFLFLSELAFAQSGNFPALVGQRGTTTPTNCSIGQLFFDTDATAGSNIYGCTAANTWTQQGGASGLTNPVTPSQGGTGVANNNAATLTRSGNHALTLTTVGVTGVTLPTSGTLATVVAPASWTPTISFATPGTLDITYGSQVGNYQTVGGRVFVDFQITTSAFSLGTATGNMRLPGLPVTPTGSAYGACTVGGITKTGFTSFTVQAGSGNSFMSLAAIASGSAAGLVNASDSFAAATSISCSISYPG